MQQRHWYLLQTDWVGDPSPQEALIEELLKVVPEYPIEDPTPGHVAIEMGAPSNKTGWNFKWHNPWRSIDGF